MTVGIDVSQAVYGTGVSDYTINLFNALKKNFPKETFIPTGFSFRRQQDIKKLFPDARVFPIPPKILDKMWNRLHITNFETFSGNINVYHSSDWTQAPSIAKKITTIHDLAPIIYPKKHDPEIVSVHKRRLSWVAAECDAVICVSQSTKNDFLSHFNYSKEKVFVIPEALPSRYLLKPKKNEAGEYIFALGARQPRKNIQRLISAHEKFAKKYKLPKLIVAGEGGIGYVSDQKLVDLLANAKCLVYPSIQEGFGLNILAAFHFGIPVACSDIPVFHEVAGDSATYFDPYDEESIAKAISRANSSANQVPKSRANQLDKFSWDKAASQTMEVYKSLC